MTNFNNIDKEQARIFREAAQHRKMLRLSEEDLKRMDAAGIIVVSAAATVFFLLGWIAHSLIS